MTFKVHHIGYAVPAIERAVKEFEVLGWSVSSDVTDDAERKVSIVFMTRGESCIELVAPTADDSPVKKMLQKGSGAPYHICYEVPQLEEAIEELKKNRFILTKKPAPAPAIGGRRVAFLYGLTTGVLELVETGVGLA